MHQICDWARYFVTFMPTKIQSLSAPQNDSLNLVFVKDINIIVYIIIGSKTSIGAEKHIDIRKLRGPRQVPLVEKKALLRVQARRQILKNAGQARKNLFCIFGFIHRDTKISSGQRGLTTL